MVFPAPAGVILNVDTGIEKLEIVFPAPAGVIPLIDNLPLLLDGFPRTCGGDPTPFSCSKIE